MQNNKNIATLQLLLDKGADMETKSYVSPIAYSQYFVVRMICVLIWQGKNATPLIIAAEKGFIKAIESMLDRGANIEISSIVRNIAHMYSAYVHTYILIRHSNAVNRNLLFYFEHCIILKIGSTPLTVSALRGHTNVVALLCERGANIEARDFVRSKEIYPLQLIDWIAFN